eukprot:3725711-Pleurochrysis_carterae.AAC.2
MRLYGRLHLVGRLARNCSKASRNHGVVDGHDPIDCLGPKPLISQSLAAARQMRQGRSYCGVMVNEDLAEESVEALFAKIAALLVSQEGLEAAIHFHSARAAQIVCLQILCCKVVEAQLVAEAKGYEEEFRKNKEQCQTVCGKSVHEGGARQDCCWPSAKILRTLGSMPMSQFSKLLVQTGCDCPRTLE